MMKRKNRLRFISFVCVAVMLSTGLWGCAGKKQTSAETKEPMVTEAPDVSPTATDVPATPTPTSPPTSTPTPTPTSTPTPSPTVPVQVVENGGDIIGVLTVDDWASAVELPPIRYDYVISKVNEFVNVREGPGTEYKIIGKLRLKSYGRILEREENWTKITSGDVEGWVHNDYLYMDEEAIALVAEWDVFNVTINAGTMNVRKEPNTDCPIIGQATYGQEYVWYPELSDEDWYAIQYDEETIAYVSAIYTTATSNLDKALTMEQEEARVRAEWYRKAMEYSKAHPPAETNRAPMNFTDEELYLLSVVIAMEALYEPYEGKLMVANVIINRILYGEWGHTLYDVVHAPGQFTGANSGRIEAFWNKPNESALGAECKQAAVAAAAGQNNIEDYLFFISIGKARYDLYYQYYVYHGHCFYKRHW